MAEEDEVDVLGDFNLDSFLAKSDAAMYENSSLVSQAGDLLNCDYTIHPQWLLDRPSANLECWYDTNAVLSTELPDRSPMGFGANDNDQIGHVSTENSITDESGWTEKEKNLLERGIEIFGKSNFRLSQFIGSKTSNDVRYYLKNFYSEVPPTYSSLNGGMVEGMSVSNLVSEILVDNQIPASIEEVIAAVSTAKPTVAVNKRQRKKSNSSSNDDEYFKNFVNVVKTSAERKEVKVRSPKLELKPKFKSKTKKLMKCKFRTELKVPVELCNQKTVKVMNHSIKRSEVGKVEITTGPGLAVPICEGEEIIKINKDDTDSDVEIDVVDSTDSKCDVRTEHKAVEMPPVNELDNEDFQTNSPNKQKSSYIDLTTLDDYLVKKLTSLEEPKREVVLNENFISDLEKVVHSEFFKGRPTKTPLRYLKIRNHIINCWTSTKPSYITKTSIRQGLKNCGDVNCISRIHCYLEQTGVINFGCPQTSYSRPLYDVFQAMAPVNREKPSKDLKPQIRSGAELGARSRIKRKLANDGEGGYTLTHDEKGDVINTTIVTEEPAKPRFHIKKPAIRLIYCRPFSVTSPQKFAVKLHLTTLLLMDLHAHTSLSEIMGLVAGTWDSPKSVLTISHYEPCRNIASSSTHCDMCPISQAKAAERIHDRDLRILGWFHSHPTFAPEPSQQDLDTQQDLQRWIGDKNPCLGVILSPFSANGALIASPFRCLIVDQKENFEDQFVPYKFRVELVADEIDVDGFLRGVETLVNSNSEEGQVRSIDFSKPYFQDVSITYLEKYITSVRMHLARCGNLNKMTCDSIIEGIESIIS